jgi:hypothetical protein
MQLLTSVFAFLIATGMVCSAHAGYTFTEDFDSLPLGATPPDWPKVWDQSPDSPPNFSIVNAETYGQVLDGSGHTCSNIGVVKLSKAQYPDFSFSRFTLTASMRHDNYQDLGGIWWAWTGNDYADVLPSSDKVNTLRSYMLINENYGKTWHLGKSWWDASGVEHNWGLENGQWNSFAHTTPPEKMETLEWYSFKIEVVDWVANVWMKQGKGLTNFASQDLLFSEIDINLDNYGLHIWDGDLYVGFNQRVGHSQYDDLIFEVAPEPATLSLLALGGAAVMARRNRRK